MTGSTVKVAKSNSTFTDSAAADAGALPATDKFILTVNVDGNKAKDISFEAYEVVGVTTITLTDVNLGGNNLASATIDGDNAVASATVAANGNIVVTLTNALTTLENNEMTRTSATINITTKDPVTPTVSYSTGVKAKSYEFKYKEGNVEKTITGPMFAIYGNVKGDVTEYGIAVSFEGDFEVGETDKYSLYSAAESDANGDFGVAIIDDSIENPTPMTKAYAKLYYKIGGTTTFVGKTKIVNFK